MPTDPIRRSAARTATLVALPVALLVGLASLWILGAFNRGGQSPVPPATQHATSAVSMPARPLGSRATDLCRDIIAELPDAVGDARRRPVTVGAEQNAAYGDPPLTLACGAPPPTVPQTAMVSVLSGVCWYAAPGASGTVWTTVDREVAVALTVPGPQAGSAQSVIPFSTPIAGADPRIATPPFGCR